MSAEALGVLLTGGAGILTTFLAFLAGNRRASGRVSTTDADRLWAEAARIRADLMTRVDALEGELHELRGESAEKDIRILTLEHENTGLKLRVGELERELAHLRIDG